MKKKADKKKRVREALTTGLFGGYSRVMKVTTENIKKSRYYDHFKNGLHLNITQIKALLNAPSLTAAQKLVKKMKGVPDYAAYQVRKYWGYKAKRVEKCFVCNKSLYFEEEDDRGDSVMLYSPAVYFRTGGNWPSTVLDMEDKRIEILICDDCVKERKNRMFIVEEKPPTPVRKIHKRIGFKEYRDEQIKEASKTRRKRPRSITDSAPDS